MASGLFSGASGLAVGRGLTKAVSGLWSGASGLDAGFGSSGSTYDPATVAYLAAMAVQPDTAQAIRINTLIVALKSAGVWTKLGWFGIHAAHDAQAGRINAVNPAQVATAVNSPTFTLFRGFTGDGATSYLDTGLTVGGSGTLLAQNDGHMGAWVGTDVQGAVATDIGGRDSRTVIRSRIGTSTAGYGANVTGATTVTIPANTSVGHTSWSRNNSANFDAYKDGSLLLTSPTASSALTVTPYLVLAAWNVIGLVPTAFSSRRVQATHFGSALNSAEMGAFHTALSTYMASLP